MFQQPSPYPTVTRNADPRILDPRNADPRVLDPRVAEYGAPQSFAPPQPEAGPPKGLFGRLANPSPRYDPVPELVEPSLPQNPDMPPPNDARLRSRISDAVRNVAANPPPPRPTLQPSLRADPPVSRQSDAPRPQRAPLIADTRPDPRYAVPAAPRAAEPATYSGGADDAGVPDYAPVPDYNGVPDYRGVPDYHGAPDYTAVPDYSAVPDYPSAQWVPEHHYQADTYDGGQDHDLEWNQDDYAPAPRPSVLALGPDQRRAKVQAGVKKPPAPSRRAIAETHPPLRFEDTAPVYDLPPLSLLASPDTVQRYSLSHEALEENARMLE
ncbi:MAG: hypothetical protein ACK4SS_09165, partial [Cypionkella sp.]